MDTKTGMRNMLDKVNENQPEEEKSFGMSARLYFPNGRTFEYVRLINPENVKKTELMSFFSDDMMYSFVTAVNEGSKSPLDSSTLPPVSEQPSRLSVLQRIRRALFG